MELKNIAILGPGGNVGKAIINELLKHNSRFAITAITRPSSTYVSPDSTINTKSADLDSLDSLVEAFKDQDAVVNCVSGGAMQYEPAKLIIDATITAGVSFYFAGEFVGNVQNERFKRLPEAVVGAKGKIRADLEQLGNEGKIKWTALNGGPFFDMWLMRGPAGFDIPHKQARIYGTGENKLYWTPLPTIAHAAVNMLLSPDTVLNRPVFICPFPSLTQNAILSAVEKVLGTKLDVVNVDVKAINENARAALEKGEIGKAMRGLTISYQFYEGDSGNDFNALIENEVVGVKEMSVEDAVKQAIEIYGTESPVVESMFRVDP